MSDIASKGDYKAKKRDWDKKFPVKRGGGNKAVEEAARQAAERERRRKEAQTRFLSVVAALNFCLRHGIPIHALGMNTTRGASHTDFRRNTAGKGLLDRCGRTTRKQDTSDEATFDEIANYTQYGDVIHPLEYLEAAQDDAIFYRSPDELGIDLSGTAYA